MSEHEIPTELARDLCEVFRRHGVITTENAMKRHMGPVIQRLRHRGRPLLDIDPSLVALLASTGMNQAKIAQYFDCDPDTIGKRFSDAYRRGRGEFAQKIDSHLADIAFNSKDLARKQRALEFLAVRYQHEEEISHSADRLRDGETDVIAIFARITAQRRPTREVRAQLAAGRGDGSGGNESGNGSAGRTGADDTNLV